MDTNLNITVLIDNKSMKHLLFHTITAYLNHVHHLMRNKMSFSKTDMEQIIRLLSENLPEFCHQQTLAARFLQISAERMSAHQNKCLREFGINEKDVVIGIAASGGTPYVYGGLKAANEAGLVTGCVVCNKGSKIAAEAKYPVEVVVGPEFVTGSTRMKAGSAQKMVLNMISTTVMIQLGRVKGNKMVDMQLTNNKLFSRGVRIIMDETGIDAETAADLLEKFGSVRNAINNAKIEKH